MGDLKYTSKDDDANLSWLPKLLDACWHIFDICKMGLKEELGVVDENLKVHGVQHPKLVDSSISWAPRASQPTQATLLWWFARRLPIFVPETWGLLKAYLSAPNYHLTPSTAVRLFA
jgi:choline dehydrogenase-like flavoprotein